MGFLGDPIPYDPWFVVLPVYTCAFLTFFLFLAIAVTILSKSGRTSPVVVYPMAKGLLVSVLVLSGLFFVCLLFPVLARSHVSSAAAAWQSYNDHISTTVIFVNLGGALCSSLLLARLMKRHRETRAQEGFRKGFYITLFFLTMLILPPWIESYFIGASFARQKNLLISSFLGPCAIFIVCGFVKRATLASCLRWASLALLTTFFSYPLTQSVWVRLQVPNTFKYSAVVVEKLERTKEVTNHYPAEIDVSSWVGKEPPRLIHQQGKYFYDFDRSDESFILRTWVDPWTSFEYSSKEKKWMARRGNWWY